MSSSMLHPMIDEIKEQPEIIRDLVARRSQLTRPFVDLFRLADVKRLYFVGAGSPLYAAEVMRYAAISLLGVDAVAYPPSLFNAHVGFDLNNLAPNQMMLICPAESGRSKGQVDAARTARGAGIPVVCTTLNPTGVLARECNVVLQKPGGHEEAYVTTKGQTIALLLMYMCMLDAAHELGRITDESYACNLGALDVLGEHVEATIKSSLEWFAIHRDELMDASSYRFIGYGSNFGTINECMLKISESLRRPAWAYELEETLHGPMISMGSGDMLFLLAAEDGYEKERMLALAKTLQSVTPHVVVMQSDAEEAFDAKSLRVRTDNVEFIDAIEYMIPVQVLSCCMSDALGIDTTVDPYDDLHKQMETKYED